MSKRSSMKHFNMNDKVFAKLKGYAAWPAKIADYNGNNKKYCVKFYGTGEIGYVYAKSLFIYNEENKKIYINQKTTANRFFYLGVIEIESELRGEDMAGAADDQKPATTSIGATAATTPWKSEAEDIKNFSLAAPWAAVSIKEEPENQNHVGGYQLRSRVALASSHLLAMQPPKEEPGVLSDIGNRLIGATASTSSRSQTTMPPKEEPGGQEAIENRVDAAGPSTSSRSSRGNPSNRRRRTKELPKTFMAVEKEFCDLFNELQNSFHQLSANVKRGLEILRELQEVEVNRLKLLRNFQFVENIKKLRTYVGQPTLWNLDARAEEEFKEKATEVRALAEQIYARYMDYFGSEDPWSEYSNQVAIYKDATVSFKDRECISMLESTYEKLLTKKKPWHYYPPSS